MKNKKRIFLIIGSIILVIFIVLSDYLPKQKKSSTTTPSTINSPYSQVDSFPSVIPIQSSKLKIDWSRAVFNNPEKQYYVYNAQKLLTIDLANEIAAKLNFSSDDKKVLSHNNVIWKSGDQNNILLFTPKEEALAYQNLVKPQSNLEFNDTEVVNKTIEIINLLFPQYQFRIASISYFKDKYYSDETSRQQADIVKVSIDQVHNNYSIIPSNLTSSHTVILFLNKDLSIRTIDINNGFSNIENLNFSKTYDLEKLKLISPNSLITLTPLKLDRQSQYNEGSQALFRVNTVDPALVNVNDTLSPVYLISGKIQVDNLAPFPENVQYIAPMN